MPTSEGQKRYARRIMLPAIGVEGQAIISRSRVAVVGCGGLGPVLSQIMVGMGARRVTVIDNDRPDITNLHRQIVHDETDVRAGHMKALVAADKLKSLWEAATARARAEGHKLTQDVAAEALGGLDFLVVQELFLHRGRHDDHFLPAAAARLDQAADVDLAREPVLLAQPVAPEQLVERADVGAGRGLDRRQPLQPIQIVVGVELPAERTGPGGDGAPLTDLNPNKYRHVGEMDRDIWYERGDPRLFRAIREVWNFAQRLIQPSFPPGVYRFGSAEDAAAQRELWEGHNIEAMRRRMRPTD